MANTGDTVAPTAAITAPMGGATVSGSVTIAATASDNVGVAGVQFLLDNNTLGAEDTTSPYSVSWNTTTAANGTHTLTARARDVNGNTALSAPVTVNVANAASATPAFVQVNAAPFHGCNYRIVYVTPVMTATLVAGGHHARSRASTSLVWDHLRGVNRSSRKSRAVTLALQQSDHVGRQSLLQRSTLPAEV